MLVVDRGMFWDGKDAPRSIAVDIKAHSLYKFVSGTKVGRGEGANIVEIEIRLMIMIKHRHGTAKHLSYSVFCTVMY